jgi:hypothetical protein
MVPLPLGAFCAVFPVADEKSAALRLGVYTYVDITAIGETIFQLILSFRIGVLTCWKMEEH